MTEIALSLSGIRVKNRVRKDAQINIRLSSNDLIRLKQKAAFEGIPYQTLICEYFT